MVIFRVTENINIKTTDGTLVKYLKLRNPSQLLNTSLYITTFDELEKLEEVFSRVGEKYKAKVLFENRITSNNAFPEELGILNKYEYKSIKKFQNNVQSTYHSFQNEFPRFFLNEESVCLKEQLSSCKQDEVKIAILGNVGEHIGEMVASLTALRLLHEFLTQRFKQVRLDVFIEASENKFYTRDKAILTSQEYINSIYPLSVTVKKFCEYDFYIDNSSTKNRSFYKELPYVDSYLHKFGLNYKNIPDSKKYNHLDIGKFVIKSGLKERMELLKKDSKLLLFHPYSAEINRSIPKEIAAKMLEKLLKKAPNYTIISTLNISDIQHENYVNLINASKTIQDFIYIVSCMDKIITTDTSTYHIADAFFIPTVVFFYEVEPKLRIKYYNHVKAIKIEDKSLNFSQFKFGNDELILHKFDSWKNVKISKVMKLLETI